MSKARLSNAIALSGPIKIICISLLGVLAAEY